MAHSLYPYWVVRCGESIDVANGEKPDVLAHSDVILAGQFDTSAEAADVRDTLRAAQSPASGKAGAR